MGLGVKRPLCCFCWLFVLTCALYLLFPAHRCLVMILLGVGTAGVLLFFLLPIKKRHRQPEDVARFRYVCFLLVAVLFGTLFGGVRLTLQANHTQVYVNQHEIIHATVLERESSSSYQTQYLVSLEQIGEDQDRICALMTCTFVAPLSVGDRVCCVADLSAVEETYWRASGAILQAEVASAEEIQFVERVTGKENPLLFIKMKAAELQMLLALKLRQQIGGDEGALCAALLLGEDSELPAGLTLNFRRSGVSHLLALSGMHLGILMALVSRLLNRLKLPYRLKLDIAAVTALFYLMLTGCATSTLRATVMLLWMLWAKRMGKEADALTSLSLFFAVCIGIRPTMLYDISLWLSSLAVLVPIAVFPAWQQRKSNSAAVDVASKFSFMFAVLRRIKQKIVDPMMIGLLCTLILLVPMWMTFGETSLLSPISTVLLTFPLTGILCLGLLYLLLLPLSGWSVALFWLNGLAQGMKYLAYAMLRVTETFGRLPNTMLSLRYHVLTVTIPVLGAVLVLIFLIRCRRRTMLLLLSIVLTVGFVGSAAEVIHRRNTLDVTYVVSGNSELLCLSDQRQMILCDWTDGSYRAYDRLFREDMPNEHTEIHALVLTHYHSRHVALLERLCGTVRLQTLYLPISMPYCEQEKAEDDEGIARKLMEIAKAYGTDVVLYDIGQTLAIGASLTLDGLNYAMIKRSAHPVLAMSLTWREQVSVTYLGGAFAEESGISQFADACVSNSEVVILGGHGPVTRQDFSIVNWSDTLHALLIHGDATGAFLEGNDQTVTAIAQADCHALFKGEDGESVTVSVSIASD